MIDSSVGAFIELVLVLYIGAPTYRGTNLPRSIIISSRGCCPCCSPKLLVDPEQLMASPVEVYGRLQGRYA